MNKLFSNAPFEVTTPFDPAIERDCDVEAYAELRDWSLLKFAAGMDPTVYVTRRLPSSIVGVIESQTESTPAIHRLAFMTGVVAIKNLHGTDGVHYPMWVPEWCKPTSDSKSQSMTNAELDLIARDESLDIGSVVWGRTDLRHGKPVCFVAPQSSGTSLGKKERSFRRAELADLPSKKQSEPKELSALSNLPASEPGGDVTVLVE